MRPSAHMPWYEIDFKDKIPQYVAQLFNIHSRAIKRFYIRLEEIREDLERLNPTSIIISPAS